MTEKEWLMFNLSENARERVAMANKCYAAYTKGPFADAAKALGAVHVEAANVYHRALRKLEKGDE